jgi:hypothetical protein
LVLCININMVDSGKQNCRRGKLGTAGGQTKEAKCCQDSKPLSPMLERHECRWKVKLKN